MEEMDVLSRTDPSLLWE